jgi:hypothetical protein
MKEILIEIKNIKESPSDLRKFGITIGSVLLLIAPILFILNKAAILWGIIGILFIISGLLFPAILKPLNRIWMSLAILLGWIMTRVILSILFYFAFTLIRFIALAFNKKFLDFKIDPSAKTYWEKREKKNIDPTNYERQF